MTIDDLIGELEEFRRVHGNLDVKYIAKETDKRSDCFGDDYPADFDIAVERHLYGTASIVAIRGPEK